MKNHGRVLSNRIRDARIRLSFTQQQLAEEAGFSSAQIISQIEKGQRDVKAWELFNLAKALRLEVSQLLAAEAPEVSIPILWRKTPAQNKELIEAEFIKRCHQYSLVEKLCKSTTKQEFPRYEIDFNSTSFGEVEGLSKNVCNELDLGSRPACSLKSVLEDKYKVKIWYENLGEETSAATMMGPFGAAVLINLIEAPWRRNFSLAHELFHLITWDSMDLKLISEDAGLKDRIERFANAFAASILLPDKYLIEAFQPRIENNKVTQSDLIEIAREFDVSTEALLYRLINLDYVEQEEIESVLDSPEFRELDRSFRVGEWGKPPSIPERFVRLAFLAYQMGNLSCPRLAELLNTNLVDLTDKLLEYGLDDRVDYQTEVRASGR